MGVLPTLDLSKPSCFRYLQYLPTHFSAPLCCFYGFIWYILSSQVSQANFSILRSVVTSFWLHRDCCKFLNSYFNSEGTRLFRTILEFSLVQEYMFSPLAQKSHAKFEENSQAKKMQGKEDTILMGLLIFSSFTPWVPTSNPKRWALTPSPPSFQHMAWLHNKVLWPYLSSSLILVLWPPYTLSHIWQWLCWHLFPKRECLDERGHVYSFAS